MFTRSSTSACFCLAIILMCGVSAGHPADENPDLTLPESTKQFRQDRFGMFIHWGIYSVLGDGEAVMTNRKLSAVEYERLGQFFNPADFDAARWVSLAKSAGMRYITFTARHDDGLAMWGSTAADWNVVNRTPFARDVVKELADACHHEGIKLFLSYSWQDKHKPELAGDNDGDTTASVTTRNAELTELLTDYGKIDGVRLDGWAGGPGAESQLQPVYNLIRRFQPSALIGNSHGQAPMPGEDYQIGKNGLQDEKATGDGNGVEYSPVPLEVSSTINESRGFRLTDHQHKSTRDLVHALVRAAGMDANLLLHVGAMPNGQIQPEFTERLRRMGMWLAKNGESVYATRGGPMAPQPWGVTTHRGKRIYVHVLDAETTAVELQVPSRLRSARYITDDSAVAYEGSETTAILTLRPEGRGELERLVVLETGQYL